jgi:hypothetical protein
MLKRVGPAGTAITAVVALIASTVSLLYQLVPALKPDPREHVGADVSIYRIEPHLTLAEWVTRAFTGKKRKKLRHDLFDVAGNSRTFPGEGVYVKTTVDGYKHREVSLKVTLYDARTEEPYNFDLPASLNRLRIDLDAPSRRSVQLLWIPDLTQEPRQFFIQVELSDKNGVLALDDSPTLRNGRIRQAL